MKQTQRRNITKTTKKVVKLKVPKKKQQLYTTINVVFGLVALVSLINAGYIAYSFFSFEVDDATYQRLMLGFIKSLYYPIFYLFGYLLSRRAFFARRFQTAIWFALLIPLAPVLILALSWN